MVYLYIGFAVIYCSPITGKTIFPFLYLHQFFIIFILEFSFFAIVLSSKRKIFAYQKIILKMKTLPRALPHLPISGIELLKINLIDSNVSVFENRKKYKIPQPFYCPVHMQYHWAIPCSVLRPYHWALTCSVLRPYHWAIPCWGPIIELYPAEALSLS